MIWAIFSFVEESLYIFSLQYISARGFCTQNEMDNTGLWVLPENNRHSPVLTGRHSPVACQKTTGTRVEMKSGPATLRAYNKSPGSGAQLGVCGLGLIHSRSAEPVRPVDCTRQTRECFRDQLAVHIFHHTPCLACGTWGIRLFESVADVAALWSMLLVVLHSLGKKLFDFVRNYKAFPLNSAMWMTLLFPGK